MFANLRAGRFAQGGSTLTQQLAKNFFLTPDRTLTRKFAELGLALWLEMRLSKPEILNSTSIRSTSAAALTASRRRASAISASRRVN